MRLALACVHRILWREIKEHNIPNNQVKSKIATVFLFTTCLHTSP